MPLIHLEKPRSAEAVRRAKRTFDIVGTLGLLLLFSPVFAFSAFRVWSFDRGPILFRQIRVGRDGAAFYCWKFRTMVTNAEELLADLHDQQGYEGGLFKMENDPRITPPGKWMRRFSLDELPQLVNVLKGDMSLVGPRPPLKHEVAQYDDAHGPPPARPPGHDRPVAGLRPLGARRGPRRSGSTSTTSTTGRCSRTSPSWPAPSAPSSAAAAPTEPTATA